jgi:hypothetical protein
MRDYYCGVKLLWSWDYRFWSWFTFHGVYAAYMNGKNETPDRLFDKIYHLGPLKIKVGVIR